MSAVELRLGQIRRCLAQDLVRSAQLAHLTFKLLHAVAVIALQPAADARVPAYLGSLLLRAGHLDRAAEEYRAALAIDPTLEDVRKGLESIEARRSRAAERASDSSPP